MVLLRRVDFDEFLFRLQIPHPVFEQRGDFGMDFVELRERRQREAFARRIDHDLAGHELLFDRANSVHRAIKIRAYRPTKKCAGS